MDGRCARCGYKVAAGQKYCRACERLLKSDYPQVNYSLYMGELKICERCGQEFAQHSSAQKYCDKCSYQMTRERRRRKR